MEHTIDEIRNKLSDKSLKVTPQRIAILDAIYKIGGHPTADNIIEYIRKSNPNIASGTVYKVLDTFIEKKIIKRVTTDRDVMRYDGIMDKHHHLYCSECDIIEDFVDEELDLLLNNYFKNKQIKGFNIREFVVQIKGTFDKC
ncbi:transcriptional repressor [Carboxylicivirga sp. A043]|uniref:Fur family transcriptional regulator n=1 Tax=Carboxylicivirga litoralis TaxID=2816963 RepID=UPI0021CB3793|nr:transcriptional repressor [Carboxylicivirga sp. A043]MCU4155538.1 transcriptional repressor [Carboxylicivirga sp. A043]